MKSRRPKRGGSRGGEGRSKPPSESRSRSSSEGRSKPSSESRSRSFSEGRSKPPSESRSRSSSEGRSRASSSEGRSKPSSEGGPRSPSSEGHSRGSEGRSRGGASEGRSRGGASEGRSRGSASGDDPHVVVGRRFSIEALRGGTVDRLYLQHGLEDKLVDLVDLATENGVKLQLEAPEALDRRCGFARHQGVVAIGPPFPFVPLDRFRSIDAPLLIALDEIQDPQNLGAILRSALAFGADGAILPKHRSAQITPAVVRASAGASERSSIARVTNLQRALQELSEEGRDVVGLAADGEVSIADLGPAPRGRVIVVGSEGAGLRRLVRERCTRLAAIPQLADFDSLNASVASAIALYEAARAR